MAASFVARFDAALHAQFPLPIGQCSADSELGAWFVPPSHHLYESTFWVSLAILIIIVSGRAFRRQLSAHGREAAKAGIAVRKPDPPTLLVRFFDAFFTCLLFVSICTVVVHKWNGGKMPYLLQPCHMLHTFLLYIITRPRGSTEGAVLLSIYLHELSAPFLGTVAADMSCYKQRFELLNWGVQHVSLLVVPMYLVATRRFGERVHGGAALFWFSFACLLMFHYLVLVPMSAATGTNLNYVMCPPPSQGWMYSLGKWYRTPMIFVCAVLSWLLRYLVIDGFIKCFVERKQHSKVQPEDSGEEEDTSNSAKRHTSAQTTPAQNKDGLRKRA